MKPISIRYLSAHAAANILLEAVADYFADLVPPLTCNRSPGPDVEIILRHFDEAAFIDLRA